MGVLAAAVLVGVNPLEQLARGRDASKLSTVNGLGKAVQSYYTTQNGTYPGTGAGWMNTLQTAGEIKVVPLIEGKSTTSLIEKAKFGEKSKKLL